MANIAEVDNFDAAVYEIATTDPVEGGPGGISNAQAQALANRTLWLKNRVESVWLPGDIKEVDCDDAYILANFDGTGLGTNERLGWAICNGQNGTKNRNGRVGVAWGTIYSSMGATFGSKDAVVVAHTHTGVPLKVSDGDRGIGNASLFSIDSLGTTESTGVSGTDKNMQPSIVTLVIMKLP